MAIVWQYFIATCMVFISTISNGFLELFDSFENNDRRYHKAAFGSDREFINETNDGFCVNGLERISRIDSFEGVLLTGAIGTGKGINIIIPNILRLADGKTTLICHDPSGEAWAKTSGHTYLKDYDVITYRLNCPSESDYYNPMDNIRNKAQAYKLASILMDSNHGNASSDPFWQIQGVTTTYAFIAIVMKLEQQYRTLYNVRHLLIQFSIDRDRVKHLFIKKADDELMETFLSIYALEDKVLRSVIATSLSSLALWSDENIVKVTSSSTLDFKTLRTGKPKCIYVLNHTTDMKLYTPLINILFDQLTDALFEHLPTTKDHDVAFIMDEMSGIRLKNLPTILLNCRKYRLAFLCAYQSTSIIISCYPNDWEAITSSLRTKIWLGGQGLEGSKHLEELIGREDVTDYKGNTKTRYLISQEEIRKMQANMGLVISPQGQCYQVKMYPYFEQIFFNMKTKHRPVTISKSLLHHIPLTPINVSKEK